jgi:arginine repressor
MKNTKNDKELLLTYLIKSKIASAEDLKSVLGTSSRMTVFRRLTELNYISSCSHSGKYYCLKRTARFNRQGIWLFNSVVFSKHGTLKNTLESLISSSSDGCTASELNKIVKCKTGDVLLELKKTKKIIRKKISGVYVYFSKESNSGRKQELNRKGSVRHHDRLNIRPGISVNELNAALIIFFSTLNEKQRRLYAGYESLKSGHGGDRQIAELLGLDQRTVAKGRQELLSGEVDVDTVRKKGGGRKQIKKKIPDLIERIEKLMEYETAGDPMSDLKWTRKTTQKIADELLSSGIVVSNTTVGKLLKNLKYSLKTNVKAISNGGRNFTEEERRFRNIQFDYINEMIDKFVVMSKPAVSVDTKKKEPIGNFKNPGTRYKREADLTNDHDFLTYALGIAAPYGVYDQQKNAGFVSVGIFPKKNNRIISGDTPEFAAECVERWWINEGIRKYHDTDELLILADAGGSNGYRPHMWKVRLQEIFCDKHKLKVTVCHYPPGASKWNAVEHRLFSEISKSWRGTPLIDYETVYIVFKIKLLGFLLTVFTRKFIIKNEK